MPNLVDLLPGLLAQSRRDSGRPPEGHGAGFERLLGLPDQGEAAQAAATRAVPEVAAPEAVPEDGDEAPSASRGDPPEAAPPEDEPGPALPALLPPVAPWPEREAACPGPAPGAEGPARVEPLAAVVPAAEPGAEPGIGTQAPEGRGAGQLFAARLPVVDEALATHATRAAETVRPAAPPEGMRAAPAFRPEPVLGTFAPGPAALGTGRAPVPSGPAAPRPAGPSLAAAVIAGAAEVQAAGLAATAPLAMTTEPATAVSGSSERFPALGGALAATRQTAAATVAPSVPAAEGTSRSEAPVAARAGQVPATASGMAEVPPSLPGGGARAESPGQRLPLGPAASRAAGGEREEHGTSGASTPEAGRTAPARFARPTVPSAIPVTPAAEAEPLVSADPGSEATGAAAAPAPRVSGSAPPEAERRPAAPEARPQARPIRIPSEIVPAAARSPAGEAPAEAIREATAQAPAGAEPRVTTSALQGPAAPARDVAPPRAEAAPERDRPTAPDLAGPSSEGPREAQDAAEALPNHQGRFEAQLAEARAAEPLRPRSVIVQNVAERIAAVPAEQGTTVIRLKPHGMGLIEISIQPGRDGGLDLGLRVQNPMVLEAMQAERGAIAQALGSQQGAGAQGGSLTMDLFQPGGGQRDQQQGGQPSPGAPRAGQQDPGRDEPPERPAGQPGTGDIIRADHVNIVT